MNPVKSWLADRRTADEQAVVLAIGMLRPSRAGGWPISKLAGISVGRTYAALARLETSGKVTSGWAEGSYPRRRVYRVARSAVTA